MRLFYLLLSLLIYACSQTSKPESINTKDSAISQFPIDTLLSSTSNPKTSEPSSQKEPLNVKTFEPMPVEMNDVAPNLTPQGNINNQSDESLEAEKDYVSTYNVSHVDEIPYFVPTNLLNDYIKSHLIFPDSARLASGTSVEAQVIFLVHTDGHISDARILRSCGHPMLDKAAVEMARKMPAWQPGKSNGRPVKTNITIPVRFDF